MKIIDPRHLFFLSLTIGLALGSKLTGIFFMIPPAIALLFAFGKEISGAPRALRVGRNPEPKAETIHPWVKPVAFWFMGKKRIRRKKRNLVNILLFYGSIAFLIVIGSGIFFVISSPYNLIDLEGFKGSVFGYEAEVATGKYEAFYTRQFVNTVPILFQAEKIFPYALGWPVFILGCVGLLFISLQIIMKIILTILLKMENGKWKMEKKSFTHLSIHALCILSFLIYFIPNAFLFAKWTRFMTPIFPFFAIFAGYFISQLYYLLITKLSNFQFSIFNFQLKLGYLTIGLLVLISMLPGAAFMSIYTHEDSRVTASRWIYENITSNSYILSETANVIDIPLQIPAYQFISRDYNLTVISFDFYHMDEDSHIFPELLNHLTKADYIFIPSRRIFANHPRQATKYPLVTKYYQLLFSGRLGFEKVSEISSFPQFSILNFQFPIPDENAEETFTVFDHPVIRIYKKVESKSTETYRELFRI